MATLTCGVSTGSEIITEINDKINKAGTMLSSTDINTVLTGGRYGCIGALNTNTPKAGEFYLEVLYDGTRTMQMAVYLDGTMYTRYYASAVWSAWVSHDHAGVYEPADATILKSSAIGVSVEAYDATILKSADIGVSVEGYDATILKSASIGVSVQGYNANTVIDASYVHTDNNFTTVLKTNYDTAYGWGNHATAGYISNLVEDTTPQLGGDLDLNGKSIPLALNAQIGTTYTAVLSDAEKIITLDNASPITMTIPANASVAYPIGTKLNFMQLGAGAVTVAITTDTLNHDAALTATLHGQYAVATAVKVAATSWVLFGNLGIV